MGQPQSKHFPDLVAKLPKLDGKVIAITGCTTGTGFVAAKACAQKGAEVIMLNRQSERADKAILDIKAEVPEAKLTLVPCDLSDFDSVRTAAAEVKKQYAKGIDVLCNNAGIMGIKDIPGKQGYDTQMTTNHLSHFLLTKQLMPLLEAAAERSGEARVVNHSSEARKTTFDPQYLEQKGGNLGGDEVGWAPFSGPRFERYKQSKLANALFTYALKGKLVAKGSKVKCLVAHPGISITSLGTTSISDGGMPAWVGFVAPMIAQTQEDGTCPLLSCMVAEGVDSGDFFGPQGTMTGAAVKITPEEFCYNPDHMKILWELSEKATGEFKV